MFDEPVAFTVQPSAWLVDKAEKNNLRVAIKLKRAQARYIKWQVYGGTQLPKKKAIPVPLPKHRAKHGGLKKNWKSILNSKSSTTGMSRHFSGVPKGRSNAKPGIYKRLGVTKKNPAGKKLQLVISWEEKTEYQKQFHFYEFSQRYVRRHFARNFREKLRWYVQNRK